MTGSLSESGTFFDNLVVLQGVALLLPRPSPNACVCAIVCVFLSGQHMSRSGGDILFLPDNCEKV